MSSHHAAAGSRRWPLAQTTLASSAAATCSPGPRATEPNLTRLIEVCQTLPRNGGVALDDPLVRDKLGRMLVEIEVMRSDGLRVLARLEQGEWERRWLLAISQWLGRSRPSPDETRLRFAGSASHPPYQRWYPPQRPAGHRPGY